jgi:uncharacterized membrane protein YhaH (DUF805 family)
LAALFTCDFIKVEYSLLVRWVEGTSAPCEGDTEEGGLHCGWISQPNDGSLGLIRTCVSSDFDIPRDKSLDYGTIFAAIPVVLAVGLMGPLVACMAEDGNVTSGRTTTRNLFVVAIIVYCVNAIFSAMALFALTTELCNQEACADIDLHSDSGDPPEKEALYCIEECKPSTGVALMIVACSLWIVASLQTILLLRARRNHQVGLDISSTESSQDETKEFHT